MASFRIYDNIPKTIVNPQINTLNIPFTQNSGRGVLATIPYNISILGITFNAKDAPATDLEFTCSIENILGAVMVAFLTLDANSTKACSYFDKPVNSSQETNFRVKYNGSNISGYFTIYYYQM